MAKTIQQILEGAAMDCHKLLKSKGWKPVGKGEYGGAEYAKGAHRIGTDYHGERWWHGTEDAKAPATAVGYNHHDLAKHLQRSGLNEQLDESTGSMHDHLTSGGWEYSGSNKNKEKTVLHHYTKGDDFITLAGDKWYHMPAGKAMSDGSGIKSLQRHTSKHSLCEQLESWG